ncbi:hypothetical protein NXS19_013345 [Fusarium pseudograminearum]|nr:hypothetical protein NXS19_013345 [Fusarium pseudograminearum]
MDDLPVHLTCRTTPVMYVCVSLRVGSRLHAVCNTIGWYHYGLYVDSPTPDCFTAVTDMCGDGIHTRNGFLLLLT